MADVQEQTHVLVIPFPAQGHVMPLMKLAYCLAERGLKITFVNTEFIHDRLLSTLEDKHKELGINLVSIPDGLTALERKDPYTLISSVFSNLPTELEKLIENINESGKNGKLSCVLADENMPSALQIARKMGIRYASFYPSAAGVKALTNHVPKLIEMGAIHENGTPKNKDETIIWSSSMPGIKSSEIVWNNMAGVVTPEAMFRGLVGNDQISKFADWVFCNTFDGIEHAAIALVPNLLPIGPLLANNQLGGLWPEDVTCLSWLDQQAASSVIYLAFGSSSILDPRQYDELALGLELLGRPFLWVVRSGSDLFGRPTTAIPEGFQERVANFGKIVSWAPQTKVLSHPSIACFVTHCGWNSTVEGVSTGVPLICWPYFADQHFDQIYITTVWKVGLGLTPDEDGIISKYEIKGKLEQLLGDEQIKENSLKLKEMAMKSVRKGGSSFKNLELFVEELKR